MTIGSGSALTVGGTGLFMQTAGTTTDDGSLTLPSSGTLSLNGGSLLGKGTISGAVTSSGVVSPGDSLTQTGILTDSGTYAQGSGGTLGISIGRTTAGTSFDQLNVTKSASLNGTLTVNLINGFVPTVASTFKIMNFSSESGTFAKCNCSINSTEHFTITYQPKDVLLTVVSGPAPIVGQFNGSSSVGASYRAAGTTHSRSMVDGAAAAFRPALRSLVGPDESASVYLVRQVINAAKLASMNYVARQDTLNRPAARRSPTLQNSGDAALWATGGIAAFVRAGSSSAGRGLHNSISTGADGAIPNLTG